MMRDWSSPKGVMHETVTHLLKGPKQADFCSGIARICVYYSWKELVPKMAKNGENESMRGSKKSIKCERRWQ